jgi:hypothetical protein
MALVAGGGGWPVWPGQSLKTALATGARARAGERQGNCAIANVCVFGHATHTLRDEAKDEGGLVASAGHLPCRRQCWHGGTSRKRVRSGGSEAEGNCFFLLHTVTVTPDTLQDAGGSKFTC